MGAPGRRGVDLLRSCGDVGGGIVLRIELYDRDADGSLSFPGAGIVD